MREGNHHVVRYRIVNARLADPEREIDVHASREQIQQLVEDGYVLLDGLFSPEILGAMRDALDEISAKERTHPETAIGSTCGGAHYLRYLMDKHPLFLDLFRLKSTLSIARAVLGPQVQFDQVDARCAFPGTAGQLVAWHIHLRAVPNPLPPFFCYPHAVHCLLYLDDVDERNGLLCLLPGSHRRIHDDFPLGDVSDKPGQVLLGIKAGSCLVMHGNLWHRTLPSRSDAGPRRVVIFGYMPSWMRGDERGGVRPDWSPTEELRRTGDAETRELLGEFYWG